MDFLKKKSNVIMAIVIAVLVIGGIAGASVLSGKNEPAKETDVVVQEQEADANNDAEATEEDEKADMESVAEVVVKEEAEPDAEALETEDVTADTDSKETKQDGTVKRESANGESSNSTTEQKTSDSNTNKKPAATPKPTTTPKPTATPTPKPTATPTPEPTTEKKTCTLTIRCDTALNNMDSLKAGKEGCVPSSGYILGKTTVEFSDGETVFDVLSRVCSNNGIQLEAAYTPAYGSYYVEGINNLYEFDCGPDSGWMYKVNGWFPNYGSSSYTVENGDNIVWCYTCNGLGADVGA